MGYTTDYNGTIRGISNPNVKIFLKYLQFIHSKCEYMSSYERGKETTEWFYECDKWLGYLPEFTFNNNQIIIKSDGKHYFHSVERLCLCILGLDKNVKGTISWYGEDVDDKGVINLKNGKLYVNEKLCIDTDFLDFRFDNEKHKIISKKYDFMKTIGKIDFKKLVKKMVIETL